MKTEQMSRTVQARAASSRHSGLRQLGECIAAVIVPAVAISLIADDLSIFMWTTVAIWVIFTMATNVLVGWSGMLTFGQAAFFGTGAYCVGFLRESSVSVGMLVVLGAAAATVAALVFGILTFRTAGMRFAIMTLVFVQLLHITVSRDQTFGADAGLYPILRSSVFGIDLLSQRAFFWFVVLATFVVCLALRRLYTSSLGFAAFASRDDAVRSVALGLPIRWIRLSLVLLSGLICGIAGALFALQLGSVSPSMLHYEMSAYVVLACLLGGRYHFWGPAIGAVIFVWAQYYLKTLTNASDFWLGLVLLFVVMVRPDGVASLITAVARRVRKPRSAVSDHNHEGAA